MLREYKREKKGVITRGMYHKIMMNPYVIEIKKQAIEIKKQACCLWFSSREECYKL